MIESIPAAFKKTEPVRFRSCMREIGICREEIELKRKTRTITVNHQQYVWWYTFHDNMASVIISPVHDKTAAITIQFANKSFPFQSDDTPIAIGYFPEYICKEVKSIINNMISAFERISRNVIQNQIDHTGA